jgi:hypothetical protein
MLRLAITLILMNLLSSGFSQSADSIKKKDLVDVIFGSKREAKLNQQRSERKVYFSILPATVNAAGGGRAVITAVNAAFYLGNPATTNLSNVYIIPVTDFSMRYGLYVKPTVWSANNHWNFIGDYRVAYFPQYTWGLGGNPPESDRTLINADYLRVYQHALFKVANGLFVGPGFAIDHYYNIKETEIENTGHLDQYPVNNRGKSYTSGMMFTISYDLRKNQLNPKQGGYLLTTFRVNTPMLGSNYEQESLFIDGRKYLPVGRNNFFCFRSFYWTVLNGTTPYLDLPAVAWAPASGIASRGIQTGRYRSNAMLYGEAEQRFQISSNGLFGAVVFANVTSVSEFNTQQFKYWHAGAGFGLRLKFNKYSDANLSLDLGFSENFWSAWINLGEMF